MTAYRMMRLRPILGLSHNDNNKAVIEKDRQVDSRTTTRALMLLIALPVPFAGIASSDTWMFEENENLMTGDTYAVAYSPVAHPLVKPNFPYHNVSSRIYFVCGRVTEQVQFRFTALNIPTSGLHKIGLLRYAVVNAKWDDELGGFQFYPNREQPELHVIEEEHEPTLQRLMNHDELLIEIPFYRTGDVYFRYSLRGSSAAIASARKSCSGAD